MCDAEQDLSPFQVMWATVNIWYIAPSHQFLKSVLSFFRFWYTSKSYRCLKSALSFFKPQFNFQNIKMSRILLSINLNFGCSSCLGLLATCEKVELLPCPAFRINEAERIYVAVSQDSDMSILCHHALPGATSAGFPLTLPAQACVRFILRRYMPMPIFGWFGWTENCLHRMRFSVKCFILLKNCLVKPLPDSP